MGDGAPIILCHGITATRRYVVHGSSALPRGGFRLITFDARAHGTSGPAPKGEGYGYPELCHDLATVIEEQVPDGRVLLGGHSMGCHTVVRYALENPEKVAGLVAIGPAYGGVISEEAIAAWDELADGLESGGVEGFMSVYLTRPHNSDWRDTIERISRERLSLHEHPEALAQALRECPPSRPFDSMDELEFLDLPTLVVASHDDADPGHPYAIAEAYAARIPGARLISEPAGKAPLAWQGGRLSREIEAFARSDAVASRLSA